MTAGPNSSPPRTRHPYHYNSLTRRSTGPRLAWVLAEIFGLRAPPRQVSFRSVRNSDGVLTVSASAHFSGLAIPNRKQMHSVAVIGRQPFR